MKTLYSRILAVCLLGCVIFAALATAVRGGGSYRPTEIYNSMSIGTWTSVLNVAHSFGTVGIYTNGARTNWYRISGTNDLGRLATGGVHTVSWTGTTNQSNSVTLSWAPIDGVRAYIIERSIDNTANSWSNWAVVYPLATNWIDRGSNTWTHTYFTNVYPTLIPAPSIDFSGASSVSVPAPTAGSHAATKTYADTVAAAGTNNTALLRADGSVPLTGTLNGGGQNMTNVTLIRKKAGPEIAFGDDAVVHYGRHEADGATWYFDAMGRPISNGVFQGDGSGLTNLSGATVGVFAGYPGTGSVASTSATDTNKYLKGDGTWGTPAGGGDMLAAVYDTDANDRVDNSDAFNDYTNGVPSWNMSPTATNAIIQWVLGLGYLDTEADTIGTVLARGNVTSNNWTMLGTGVVRQINFTGAAGTPIRGSIYDKNGLYIRGTNVVDIGVNNAAYFTLENGVIKALKTMDGGGFTWTNVGHLYGEGAAGRLRGFNNGALGQDATYSGSSGFVIGDHSHGYGNNVFVFGTRGIGSNDYSIVIYPSRDDDGGWYRDHGTGTVSIAATNGIYLDPLGSSVRVLGAATVNGGLSVPASAYGAGWNGSTNVPTRDDVYDKIESMGSGGTTNGSLILAEFTTPTNYTAGTKFLPGHFSGIDKKLGQLGAPVKQYGAWTSFWQDANNYVVEITPSVMKKWIISVSNSVPVTNTIGPLRP